MEPTSEPRMRSPGVRVPPPAFLLVGVFVGWVLERRVRSLPLHVPQAIGEPLGLALVVAGLAFAYWGVFTFRRAGTAIVPMRKATSIVTDGPYRYTRNPMYTGFAILYLGLTLLMNSVWPLLFLPLCMYALVRFVIRREERYLGQAFPDEYAAYRARVKRWGAF